jgi:hypothetical protein
VPASARLAAQTSTTDHQGHQALLFGGGEVLQSG